MHRNSCKSFSIAWHKDEQRVPIKSEIPLPAVAPNVHLLIKVNFKRSILGSLFGVLFKTELLTINFHLKDGSTHSFTYVSATGDQGLLVSHYVDNAEMYEKLNKNELPPNVKSIDFSLPRGWYWQYNNSFDIRFGSSSVETPTYGEVPAPVFQDGLWTLNNDSLSSPDYPIAIKLSPPSDDLQGFVDACSPGENSTLHVKGWGVSQSLGIPPISVLVAIDSHIVQVSSLNQERRDVANLFKRPSLKQPGFEFDVAVPASLKQSKSIRILLYLKGDTASNDKLIEITNKP